MIDDTDNPDVLLSTGQAAAILNMSPSTLEKWRSTGAGPELEFVRIGRLIRYQKSTLDALVKRNTTGA